MSEGQRTGSGRLVIERRNNARISLEMWVEETTQNERYFRRASNLSRGGLRLDYTIPLPKGTAVQLTFVLPGDAKPVNVTGEIVSTGMQNELRMGVKFINVQADCQSQLDAYLDRVAAAEAVNE